MGYWLLKVLLTPFMKMFYRVEADGCERIPTTGGAVIAANHLSFIDSLFIPLVLRRRVTFLAKCEYFENPRTAWFFRLAGQIPCDRNDGTEALEAAREVLQRGGIVAIYPEGTRSPDGRLYRGRTGVARLAVEEGVPVIPCGLRGTDKVMPRYMRRPRVRGRKRVCVDFGAPLNLHRWAGPGGASQALRPATDVVMSHIGKLSKQTYVDAYARSAIAG